MNPTNTKEPARIPSRSYSANYVGNYLAVFNPDGPGCFRIDAVTEERARLGAEFVRKNGVVYENDAILRLTANI